MKDNIFESAIPVISPQEAHDHKMFGPLYHGTKHDINDIISNGFDVKKSIPYDIGVSLNNRPIGTSNGFSLESYGNTGFAPPVHFLGYGNYFTTVKAIAKNFSGGTAKGQRQFYLDSQNVLEINYGSENTMMKFWLQNGYDMTSDATKNRNVKKWIEATHNLTNNLKSQYDAVWYKGKSIRKLLDGDQICIYKPELIRIVDAKLATGLQIGAKVFHTQKIPERYTKSNVFYIDDLKSDDFGNAGRLAGSKWRGVFRADESDDDLKMRISRGVGRYPVHFIPPKNMPGIIANQSNGMFWVKWKKGGVMYNYTAEELEPFTN